jgi:hypothetical protein
VSRAQQVAAFALLMERELSANARKDTHPLSHDFDHLLSELHGHVDKFSEKPTAEHAADVANLAMLAWLATQPMRYTTEGGLEMESIATIDAYSAPFAPVVWRTLMDWSPAEAYAYGRNDPEAPRYSNPRLARDEARYGVDEWTAAQYDHAETSFYGARRVRAMRAYWLGRLRAARTGF